MLDPNLEELKDILKDQQEVHIEIGRVLKVGKSADRSVYRVQCQVIPDNFEVIARVTWSSVGDGEGVFHPIKEGDIVLLAFSGGGENAFVIKMLSSKTDFYPEMLDEGHSIFRALPDGKLYLGSQIKTLVQKIGSLNDPTENVVLGQVLKSLLSAMLAELALQAQNIIEHTHTGNAGFQTSPPLNASDFSDNKTEFEALQASPVDDELMLSDIFFTEKGS